MKLFIHSSNGVISYINNKGSIVTSTLNDLPVRESCYLIATKENLKVLPHLLESQYRLSPKIKTFLGDTHNIASSSSHAVLKQLMVVPPVVATPYTWLNVTSKIMQTVDIVNGAPLAVRENHFLTPYLRFVGLHLTDDLISFLSMIIDPRWFVNANGKTSKVIHYMGLDKPSKARLARRKVIEKIYDSRVNNVLCESKSPLKYTVHYIIKVWLKCLDSSFEFKPELFFRDKITLEKFYAEFGE